MRALWNPYRFVIRVSVLKQIQNDSNMIIYSNIIWTCVGWYCLFQSDFMADFWQRVQLMEGITSRPRMGWFGSWIRPTDNDWRTVDRSWFLGLHCSNWSVGTYPLSTSINSTIQHSTGRSKCFRGKRCMNGQFSMAMLVYQRVYMFAVGPNAKFLCWGKTSSGRTFGRRWWEETDLMPPSETA